MSGPYGYDRRTILAMAAASSLSGAAWANVPSDLAFPGAMGWAARTPGGAGGRIIRVTSLDPYGPGSIAEAFAAKGPRVIAFEVAGEIDLQRHIMVVREPFFTLAGQTAPEPGITFIRGGLDIQAHDAIIRHIRVRPGSAGAAKNSGWECDAINIDHGYRVIVDHCSTSWATDENLSVSGPPFSGATPADWQANTSHDVTISNNIIAEGLSHSTHSHGEHSKGSLINYNVRNVLIVGNLYSGNRQRNPLFGAGSSGAVINNYIVDPGSQAIMLSAMKQDWGGRPYLPGELAVIGNVMKPGPNTVAGLPLVRTVAEPAAWRLYMEDNLVGSAKGRPPQMVDPTGTLVKLVSQNPISLPDCAPRPASAVADEVLRHAGARPWSRDAIDDRIIADASNGADREIDDQAEVGGYPKNRAVRRQFNAENFDARTLDPR